MYGEVFLLLKDFVTSTNLLGIIVYIVTRAHKKLNNYNYERNELYSLVKIMQNTVRFCLIFAQRHFVRHSMFWVYLLVQPIGTNT